MSDRVIAAMAECQKVMPQVHLPLQSASDPVLSAMDRTYTLEQYTGVVRRLRAAMPGIALSTDIDRRLPWRERRGLRAHRIVHARGALRQRVPLQVFRAPRHQGVALDRDGLRGGEGRAPHPPDRSPAADLGRDPRRAGRAARSRCWSKSSARRDAGQLYGKSAHFKTVVFRDDGTPPGALRRLRVVGSTSLTLFGADPNASRGALVSIAGTAEAAPAR